MGTTTTKKFKEKGRRLYGTNAGGHTLVVWIHLRSESNDDGTTEEKGTREGALLRTIEDLGTKKREEEKRRKRFRKAYHIPSSFHSRRMLLMEMLVIGTRIVNAGLLESRDVEQADVAHSLLEDEGVGLSAAGRVAEEVVHLVECAVLGLGDEERDVHDTQRAHEAEEDVHAVRCGGDEIRGGHADGEVVQPVRRGANGHTLGTKTEREDLGDDYPRARTPRESEADGEEPDEHDRHPSSGLVRWPVARALADDSSNDEVADTHDDRSGDESRFATPFIDVEHCGYGSEPHDDSDDSGSEERSGMTAQSETSEDEGSIVQDEVDASPLLEGHNEHSDGRTLEVAAVSE